MMPMKKITFNALLNHKAHNYMKMTLKLSHQAVLVVARMKSMLLLRNTLGQRKSIVD